MTLRLVMLQYICCCPSCGTEPPPRLPGAAPGGKGEPSRSLLLQALRSCSGLDSWAESQEGPQTSPVTRRASGRLLGPLNLELPAKHQLTPHLGRLVGAEQVERSGLRGEAELSEVWLKAPPHLRLRVFPPALAPSAFPTKFVLMVMGKKSLVVKRWKLS